MLAIRLQPMRSRKLTSRRQLVIRILIPLRGNILLIPLPIVSVLGSCVAFVHIRSTVTPLTVVGMLRGGKVFVVEGWGGARGGAATHVRLRCSVAWKRRADFFGGLFGFGVKAVVLAIC